MSNTDLALRRPIANFQRTKKSQLASSSDTITWTIFVENYEESTRIPIVLETLNFSEFISDNLKNPLGRIQRWNIKT